MDKRENLTSHQKSPFGGFRGLSPKSPFGGIRGPRIFISAYACEPGLGSEIGVGWHWVLEMSKYFDLWVLTRESNRVRIENWTNSHPESQNIKFIYFDLPPWARRWKKGLRGVRTYYNIWTKLSDKLVKKTMIENDIKVFHHITYGNALWPVSKYGSSQTFIWGPIGGLETIPKEYSDHYDRKSRFIEKIRRIAINRAVKSKGLKKRCEKASLILCKTEETLNKLPLKEKSKAILFTDVAAETIPSSTSLKQNSSSIFDSPGGSQDPKPLSLLAVGRLDPWRGFDLAILAIKEVLKTNRKIHLTIVGKGPDKIRLNNLIQNNNLNQFVALTGQVDSERYRSLMQEADIILNPALKEAAVTVSFDAMAYGKPLIALDTGGYTRYFNPDYSIVLPRKDRETTIKAIADAIVELNDPVRRLEMGHNAALAANNFSWENHGKEIRDCIHQTFDQSEK